MQVSFTTPRGAPASAAHSRRTNFGMVPRGIALDSEIGKSAMALRVFICFTASADSTTRLVRGSPASVARALKVTPNRVSEAITLLVARGAVERIPQPAGRFLYRVNFDFAPPAAAPLEGDVPVQRNTPSGTAESPPSGTAESTLHTTSRSYPSSDSGGRFDEGVQKSLPLVRVFEGGKAPAQARPALSDEVIAQRFGQFWERYPESERKVAPSKCLKLYRDIIKRGTATTEELLSAVTRYAKTVDLKYVRTPYNWLDGECWHAAPAPPRSRLVPETADEARKLFDE